MIKKSAIALLFSLSIAACTSLSETSQKVETDTKSAVDLMVSNTRNAGTAAVIRTARPRLAGEEVVLNNTTLPPEFSLPASFDTRGVETLMQALDDISASTGITIKRSEISQQSTNGSAGQQGAAGAAGVANGANDPTLSGNISVEYIGTTRGLLDDIANKGNASWRYNRVTHVVEFFRYETKTLSLVLPAGSKSVSSSISLTGLSSGSSNGGSGGGSGGGSSSSPASGNVSVTENLTVNPWQSVMNGIGSILSDGQVINGQNQGAAGQSGGNGQSLSAIGAGGSAIANPELGLITVTARPPVMERVSRYISSINERFGQNVMIDVKIYSVTLDKQTSAGVSSNLIYNAISRLGGSIVSAPTLQAGTDTPGTMTLTLQNPNSKWNGSQLVGQALSQFGNVSLQQTVQVMAINGQPSPVQVGNNIAYQSGSSTTIAANVGATTTQQSGLAVVGLTANFLPLILGDNRILLQYQMQLSQLAAPLTPNASGNTYPNISQQSLPGQAFLRDGQALVLFGSDNTSDTINSSTSFGGLSKAGVNDRNLIVIVMQVNAGTKRM